MQSQGFATARTDDICSRKLGAQACRPSRLHGHCPRRRNRPPNEAYKSQVLVDLTQISMPHLSETATKAGRPTQHSGDGLCETSDSEAHVQEQNLEHWAHPVILLWAQDLGVRVCQGLPPVTEVARHAGHSKEHCEELWGEAQSTVHQPCGTDTQTRWHEWGQQPVQHPSTTHRLF